MYRRKFLQQILIASTILIASITAGVRMAAGDPHHAEIRVVDSSDRSGTSPLVRLPAGQKVTRRYTIFNDGHIGARLQVKVQPRLRSERARVTPLPPIPRAVTVPANGQTVLSVGIAMPKVPVNTLLELTMSVTRDGKECFKKTDSFLLVPHGKGGTQAIFLNRDDRTKGNWLGSYGKQAFFLPIHTGTASFSDGAVSIDRGLEVEHAASAAAHSVSGTEHAVYSGFEEAGHLQAAFEVFARAATVDDLRIPLGGNGLTTRDPIAFTTQPHRGSDPQSHATRLLTTPILVRVDCKDDKPHRLSLYFVDYNRAGRTLNVAIYDRQGHLLASQRLANYGDGAHLCFRFMGSVIALVMSPTKDNPTLSGAFVDTDTGEGLLR